jgi:hypothetical protein
MNDFEFEKKLKAAQVPARDEDYWESFPRLVSAKLRAAPARRLEPERRWLPRLAWAGSIAFACLVIGFAIGRWHGRINQGDPYALLQSGKLLHEVMTLFPYRVRAIVQDAQGVQLVLSDQPDVPASTPLWVKISDGKNSIALVTFSGQDLEIGGQPVTVLADARGGIILTGPRLAWASDQPDGLCGGLKIEAKNLNPITL